MHTFAWALLFFDATSSNLGWSVCCADSKCHLTMTLDGPSCSGYSCGACKGFEKIARIQGLAEDPAGLSTSPGIISNRVNEYTVLENGNELSEWSRPWLTFNILLGMSTLQWIKRMLGTGYWPGCFAWVGSHCGGFQVMWTLYRHIF